jgi:hypothetical protein
MVSCYKKIAAFESETRFYPNILDLGDLAFPHEVSVNKLLSIFIPFIMTYLVVYP